METTNKEFAINTPLAKDDAKISKQLADLTEFCKLLNGLFADFVKSGIIGLSDITPEMVKAAAYFDAKPIAEAVADKYNKEAGKIKYERARRDFLRGCNDAEQEVYATVKRYREQYEKSALKFYCPNRYGNDWRLRYLTLENGFIAFDGSKLIRDNTYTITNERQTDFLNRSKALFEQIKSFNDECKRLSDGAVCGVSYAMTGDAIITVREDGELIFDASLTTSMNFENKEGKQ